MNLSQLKLEAIRIIKAKPEIKSEITELYFLAESEIEEGGSVEHECSLAYNDMIEMEKGTNDFARGGKTSSATMPKNVFDVLSKNIAESYVGKKVKPKFQSEYGKTYSAQEASEVGDKVAAKIFRQRKNKMAEGGEIGEGFTISEMRELLKRLFPYSIGFSVGTFSKEGQQNINRSALITSVDDPLRGLNDTDLKSKLFFPQYKRDHEILFRIYQGGENTYFYFLLADENGDEYVGQFAFKDRGDVPSSYITGFIAFLMEQYGLPFSVNHSVMARGGRVYIDFLGTKSKENWGKENLYTKYDNTLDLFADVSDYFKELAKENIEYAIEQKNRLISILKNGKLNYDDGATLSFAKGGQIKVGDKFGSYSVTQYQPIRYDDSGGSSDGVVKLVNQKDFDTLFILYDNALRGGKWFIRKGGIQYTGKSPKEVIEKLGIKNLSIDGRMAQGGITYQDLSLEKPSIVNETKIESERFKIDEVDLFRKSKKTFSGSPSITSAADAVKIFREFWDEQSLTIFESFNVMLLNQANKIIGLYQHSKGGVTGTVADPEMVVLSAVKSLAKGVIISHNHPSGNLKPSEADIVMTNKIKSALKLVDVRLLDSIIITENSYYSFADEGKMALGGMMAKGGEIADIQKIKKSLTAKAKQKGIYENFGQKELRQLEDKYGYTAEVQKFYNWATNFDLSELADGGMIDNSVRVMPFLKFEYATEARKKLDKGELPVFDGGLGFFYLEKENKLYYLSSVTEDWQKVGEFKSKKDSLDWLSEQLKMEGFAKGGEIREFDDVLVISKNKLGMVEAIAGETYYISTPFGESFEATADDLRKVKSFAQGGAMEHMIFKGDKVLAIHKNMLIVESNFGLINIIDLSTEPLARRIGVKSTRGKDTLLAAKRYIDYLVSRKPKTMAVGGSLQGHGFEVGDLIVEDLGGYIKVTSEDGKDFFITLRTGDRETEAPLPFLHGGKVKHSDITRLATKTNEAGDEVVNLADFYEEGGKIEMSVQQIAEIVINEIKDTIANDDEVESAYYEVKDFYNSVGRSYDNQKFKEVVAIVRNWMQANKVGDEFYEEGGKIEISAQQIAGFVIDDLKDKFANDDEIESAYDEVKDFYNSVSRSYDNQKFKEVVVIVRNWMEKNKVGDEFYYGKREVGDEFYEEGGNVPQVFDVPAQFLDSKGQRKNDRKTIRELTDFVLELPQTKEIYFNEELGDYTPSRKKLHAEIINKFKKEVVCINNDKPIAIFMGGSPASGKSSFLRKYSPFLLKEEILKIDADEIRAMLPEYEGWNACQTHLETKDIVNILLSNKNIGIPCDFDIIYDGTMNSVKSYIPLMDILRERGYKIFIVFMDNVPKDVIIKRALDRYKSSGRFVPLEVIEDFFSKGKTAFNQLKNDVDGYMLVDGSSQDYRIIEQGGIKLPRDRKYSKLGTKIKASEIPMSYKKGGLSKLY